jgi:UDP-N-acetylmuramoyl-tripeptide--D-alanyl-D-alanine ligase
MDNTILKIYEIFKQCKSISTDSRILKENSIFFALKGENFDGNNFVEQALKNGCIAAVSSDKSLKDIPEVIYVEDTLIALQKLANLHRRTLNIPILAITGSNGKTTTKELISTVMAQKYRTASTSGNRNNHIGVPLTLLSMNKTVDFGIVEMGTSSPGEIETLCKIAEPNFGLITNIGKAHLEGLGSFEGVIKEKTALYNFLKSKNGTIFYNADNPILTNSIGNYSGIPYGNNEDNFCSGEYLEFNLQAAVRWKTSTENGLAKSNLIGKYNFENIMAAITVGNYFGVPGTSIDSSINCYFPRNNRSQLVKTQRNTLIIDCYNANPTSMEAAIMNLYDTNEKNKTLILGDMLELGKESDNEHKKILQLIESLKFRKVYLVGDNFKKSESDFEFLFFNDVQELNKVLSKHPESGKFILIKGSRGIKLEKCIDYL